jgi:hypothetical protein
LPIFSIIAFCSRCLIAIAITKRRLEKVEIRDSDLQ